MTVAQLEILQNNLHKSRERMHGILNDPDMKRYAILMLQEQHWSTYTKSSLTHHAWTLIEPTAPHTQPRSAIYVNNTPFFRITNHTACAPLQRCNCDNAIHSGHSHSRLKTSPNHQCLQPMRQKHHP